MCENIRVPPPGSLVSLMMSTRNLKALPGKLDIKRQSPSILYLLASKRDSSTYCISYCRANQV